MKPYSYLRRETRRPFAAYRQALLCIGIFLNITSQTTFNGPTSTQPIELRDLKQDFSNARFIISDGSSFEYRVASQDIDENEAFDSILSANGEYRNFTAGEYYTELQSVSSDERRLEIALSNVNRTKALLVQRYSANSDVMPSLSRRTEPTSVYGGGMPTSAESSQVPTSDHIIDIPTSANTSDMLTPAPILKRGLKISGVGIVAFSVVIIFAQVNVHDKVLTPAMISAIVLTVAVQLLNEVVDQLEKKGRLGAMWVLVVSKLNKVIEEIWKLDREQHHHGSESNVVSHPGSNGDTSPLIDIEIGPSDATISEPPLLGRLSNAPARNESELIDSVRSARVARLLGQNSNDTDQYLLEPPLLSEAESLRVKIHALGLLGDLPVAEYFYRHILDLWKEIPEDIASITQKKPNLVATLLYMLRATGEKHHEEELIRQVQSIPSNEDLLRSTVQSLIDLVPSYDLEGRLLTADQIALQALQVSQKFFGPYDLITLRVWKWMALRCWEQGKRRAAIDILRRIIVHFENALERERLQVVIEHLTKIVRESGQSDENTSRGDQGTSHAAQDTSRGDLWP